VSGSVAWVSARIIFGGGDRGLVTKSKDARWFTAAAFNQASYNMVGLQIGIFNTAGSLHGVQIGVLNYVGDNPKWARILPLVNLNL